MMTEPLVVAAAAAVLPKRLVIIKAKHQYSTTSAVT
jgi:hypothetical protein